MLHMLHETLSGQLADNALSCADLQNQFPHSSSFPLFLLDGDREGESGNKSNYGFHSFKCVEALLERRKCTSCNVWLEPGSGASS